MRSSLAVFLFGLFFLTGCNAEPSYRGVTLVVFNYTPSNLSYVQVADKKGNSASSSHLGMGAGEGAGACCYRFEGTRFDVSWKGYDAAKGTEYVLKGRDLEALMFTRSATVEVPPMEIPDGDAPLNLEVHVYPDEHIEFALSRKMLGQTRIKFVEATRWLYKNHKDKLKADWDIHTLLRAVSVQTKDAWLKYRIENLEDLKHYMFLYFTVDEDFDNDPKIQALLSDPARQPGDFGKAAAQFSPAFLSHLQN